RSCESVRAIHAGLLPPAGRLNHNLAAKGTTAKSDRVENALGFLVPAFDGALFSQQWQDALWDRFFTGAPERQRRSVERYNIVKRA
ncbi:hypothetical protein, partial [Sphingobium sp. MK2]|uniref:hypothetical protein n=1 Tax=Sphingobium sp. MK2 TaxID=3116540 RepID=UPI0032E36158